MRLGVKIISFKAVVLVLLVTVGIINGCSKKTVVFEKFEVKSGTNVAHWLSQSDRRGVEREQFFTKKDVERIASMGFDHIRLPIDEEQMWDDNGNRYEPAFQLMENSINWCAENNLKVIVDLHILRSHHFNAKEKPLWTDPAEQEKFFDLWRDLSKSLKKFPNSLVAYELMNEAVADDHESWNSLLARAFTAIRELERERTIVIGSNSWQSVETFDALRVPANDKNILLSFHFYKPFLLTHYAAEWTSLKAYKGPAHYPGVILTQQEFETLPEDIKVEVEKWVDVEFSKEILLEMWQKPINKAKALGLPLYCGEFGIISNAPKKETLLWYEDMIKLFEETDIGYANWNYKSDNFGLIYPDGTENKPLISVVVKK
ncbi:cellulase family glycosylhydrolase [Flavivirga amylovorans]|uniref:Cellulase family glycosylhydrolase n=1 Tax=Flavivirga amylovorans TaxID=870486 RepID=A0ABT8X294_9FLAO|nr:cellulase family glycosylhydrolase [Flavivirga amylovorans]MDO5988068.1 cellulase family glycosylhydrolase [Flavivirga amylovorans]